MLQKVLAVILPLILIVSAFFYFGNKPMEIVDENVIPQTPEEFLRNVDETTINLVQFDSSYEPTQKVMIATNFGNIKLVLYPNLAPMAVENFVELSKEGYYNGLSFDKIVKDYYIQAGISQDNPENARSIWDKPFPNELSLNLWNFKGALGMASSEKNENECQFYIIQAGELSQDSINAMEKANFPKKVMDKYKEVGGAPWLDGKHTVFGHITSGIDIVNRIANADVNSQNKPTQPVIIQEIIVE